MGKWSVVGWLVARWSVDLMKPRKNMFGVVILPVIFYLVEVYFVLLFSFFFYIDEKEKINLIDEKEKEKILTKKKK